MIQHIYKLVITAVVVLGSGLAHAQNCNKPAEAAALQAHQELLTDGTTLGQPKIVGKTKSAELNSSLDVDVRIFSVSIEDDAATEKWLVITDRSERCRLRGVVHIDRK
jgi:hypothetical protein